MRQSGTDPRARLQRVMRVAYSTGLGAGPVGDAPTDPSAATDPPAAKAIDVSEIADVTEPGLGSDPVLSGAHSGRGARRPVARSRGRWATSGRIAVRTAVAVLVVALAAAVGMLFARSGPAPGVPADQPTLALPGTPQAGQANADEPGSAQQAAEQSAEQSGDPTPGPANAPGMTGPNGTAGSPGSPTTAADTAAAAAGDVVVVHVVGAVNAPGLAELPTGARVNDAIECAGGATPEADLTAVNLAGLIQDGQQIYVPRVGETPPAVPPPSGTGSGASGASGTASAGSDSPAAPINVNTADAATLEELPGIGPALAERVIAWRTEHGAFTSVEQLTDVPGIGPAIMDRLRDLVSV